MRMLQLATRLLLETTTASAESIVIITNREATEVPV